MTDRRSSDDLGPSVEALLSAFPIPERDWERDARAIEARLSSSVAGSTDARLLVAPLPRTPGELDSTSASATPLAHSGVRTQTLADIARRSLEKRQATEREMARESLAMAAQSPRHSDETSAPRAVVGSVSSVATPALVPSAAATNVPPAEHSTPTESRPAARSAWPNVALGMAVVALAAAALLWLERPESTSPIANPRLVAATEARPPLAKEPAPSAALAEAVQELPKGLEPSALPTERAAAGVDPRAPRGTTTAVAAQPTPSAPALSNVGTAAPVKSAKPTSAQATAVAAEKPTDKSLPPDPALRPADSSGGELPVKPSTGAAQAALGSVMSGARRCVAGNEAPSSAVVVFGSDGRVQRVTVSGPAAGKSSGACIEAQLGRARVQPFAATTFSVNVAVRPD